MCPTVQQLDDLPELAGLDDLVLMERSIALGRVLVTDDIRHFMPLHEKFLREHKAHQGIIFASRRAYPRNKGSIGLWASGLIGSPQGLRLS